MNSLKRTIYLKIIFIILIILFFISYRQLTTMNIFQNNFKLTIGEIVCRIGTISSLGCLFLIIINSSNWLIKIILSSIAVLSVVLFDFYFLLPCSILDEFEQIIANCVGFIILVFDITVLFSAFMDIVSYDIHTYKEEN